MKKAGRSVDPPWKGQDREEKGTLQGWGRAGNRHYIPWRGEDKEDRRPYVEGVEEGNRESSMEGTR